MAYIEMLERRPVAISISDSADLACFGLTHEHLRDAMAEIARHLLALGARLIYGGDLRKNGFAELLFELVARHRRDVQNDALPSVTSYLAYPVHLGMEISEIEKIRSAVEGAATVVLLDQSGAEMQMAARQAIATRTPSPDEWKSGLTAMREKISNEAHARVVLGGALEGYKGALPGVAEEVLLSIKLSKPTYVLGGFGGCAREVARLLGLLKEQVADRQTPLWAPSFRGLDEQSLNAHLTRQEIEALAETPHVDQAVALLLRGLKGAR